MRNGSQGQVVSVRALFRWGSAAVVAMLLSSLIWLVSRFVGIEPASSTVAVAYAVAFVNPADRRWLRAALTSAGVELPLSVVGLALVERWMPGPVRVAAALGFGYFFGALAYAWVTQRPAGATVHPDEHRPADDGGRHGRR